MSVLDLPSVLTVVVLLILRLGIPALGLWLLGALLNRIAPSSA